MERHGALARRLADGRYCPGEELARHLGIGLDRLPALMAAAEAGLGLEILFCARRGYRLAGALELLDAGRILEVLDEAAHRRLSRLEIHDQLPSTNAYLLEAGRAGAESGLVCLAECQSAGRGRQGRVWVSPFGANLYLSLLWRLPLAPHRLGGLSLAVGAVVASVLEAEGVAEMALKWPNDLLWRGRKLGGLLLEIAEETAGSTRVVVGLGLNTRLRGIQAAAIDQPWVDLETILAPGGYGRNLLAARLIAALTETLEAYAHTGLSPFLARWERYDRDRGQPVEIQLGKRVIRGLQAGLTEQGALRLDVDGRIQVFSGGEVRLRRTGVAGSE